MLGGALADPVDRALLLFEGDTPDAAKRFANADPYVKNGLVKRWEVRPWTTVVCSAGQRVSGTCSKRPCACSNQCAAPAKQTVTSRPRPSASRERSASRAAAASR